MLIKKLCYTKQIAYYLKYYEYPHTYHNNFVYLQQRFEV